MACALALTLAPGMAATNARGAAGGQTAGATTPLAAVTALVLNSNQNFVHGSHPPCAITSSIATSYARASGCPITARLEGRLHVVLEHEHGADPICGCQNVARQRIALLGAASTCARVNIAWFFGTVVPVRTFVVVRQSGRGLVDDFYLAGHPERSVYR